MHGYETKTRLTRGVLHKNDAFLNLIKIINKLVKTRKDLRYS